VILSFDTIKGKEEMSSMNAFKEKLRGQERAREGKRGEDGNYVIPTAYRLPIAIRIIITTS
jgi:hypothetical protein